jgi:aldehyde:ferredoxin oxidoreductase
MNGYLGRILQADLSAGRVWDEPLAEGDARAFVGGSGLAARYLADLTDAHTDPLGPENPLLFMTGPLVGTAMPSAGRYSVCALSPLTGRWGEANGGGFFGPALRFAGYDGVIIRGRAAAPLVLVIEEGRARLDPAEALWGLDSYATQERLRAALGPGARVACIGVAGERQGKMAAVMNDHGRAAARGGLGAVMGAKLLKAVAVRGAATVPVADAVALKEVLRGMAVALKEDLAATSLRLAGTAGYVDLALMYGDLPARYYQQGEWEEGSNLSGVLMAEQFQNRAVGCYRCPIACGRETRAPRFGLSKVDGPEYETLGALGSLLLVDDLEAVIYAGHLCNVYGLDTISTGATIALACEMAARGILTPAQTDGLALRYGDAALVHTLIGMIARREGFGDLLAEGSAALAAQFGVPELAVVVNRMEVPLHDPRAFHGMAVTYALSPRGACHMEGDMYGVDAGQGAPEELGVTPGERFDSSAAKGRVAARQLAWRNLYNALILCQFQNPGVPALLAAFDSITGWGWQAQDFDRAGRRIIALKRLINARRGLTRADDRLPALLQQPLPCGGAEGRVPDLPTLLSGAYAELGWDAQTGQPTPQTRRELNLESEVG